MVGVRDDGAGEHAPAGSERETRPPRPLSTRFATGQWFGVGRGGRGGDYAGWGVTGVRVSEGYGVGLRGDRVEVNFWYLVFNGFRCSVTLSLSLSLSLSINLHRSLFSSLAPPPLSHSLSSQS